MCCVCRRLGISKEYVDTLSEEENEEEENGGREEEQDAVQGPRRQLASIAPREVTVVRPAPSHDGAPTFAAYSVLERTQHFDDPAERPPFGLIIYDTAPGANAERAGRMARCFFDGTLRERRRGVDPDRVEVVAFPLDDPGAAAAAAATAPSSSSPASPGPGAMPTAGSLPLPLTRRERADACIRHYEQERTHRLAMTDPVQAKSWFLPERLSDASYTFSIIIVDRLEEGWEGALGDSKDHPHKAKADRSPFGSYYQVHWQPREEALELCDEPIPPEKCVSTSWRTLEELSYGLGISGLLCGVATFYEHFLPDGILDRELELARTR